MLWPGICHMPVTYQNSWLNRSSWFLVQRLPSAYTTLCCKEICISPVISPVIILLPFGTLSQTLNLADFLFSSWHVDHAQCCLLCSMDSSLWHSVATFVYYKLATKQNIVCFVCNSWDLLLWSLANNWISHLFAVWHIFLFSFSLWRIDFTWYLNIKWLMCTFLCCNKVVNS